MPARKSSPPPKALPGAPRGNKNASKHGEATERVSLRLPASLLAHYRARAADDQTTLAAILTGTLVQATRAKP